MAKLSNPFKGKCPDCTDGLLVERINKETKNTFLGCSEWPECKHTEQGGSNPSKPRIKSSSWCDDEGYDEFDGLDMYDCF